MPFDGRGWRVSAHGERFGEETDGESGAVPGRRWDRRIFDDSLRKVVQASGRHTPGIYVHAR